MVNPIKKGKAGEKEFCKWLKLNLGLEYEPTRNYNQHSRFSADIVSVAGFCFEVKRRESLDLDSWWYQVVISARKIDAEPIVAYRQNRSSWNFLISAGSIGLEKGYIQLKEDIFKQYINRSMRGHLNIVGDL